MCLPTAARHTHFFFLFFIVENKMRFRINDGVRIFGTHYPEMDICIQDTSSFPAWRVGESTMHRKEPQELLDEQDAVLPSEKLGIALPELKKSLSLLLSPRPALPFPFCSLHTSTISLHKLQCQGLHPCMRPHPQMLPPPWSLGCKALICEPVNTV